MSKEIKVSYSSAQVAEAAQISLRTLQWWDEQGIVSPSRNGHKRVYSQQEAVTIGVIAELMRKGFKLRRIVPVIAWLNLSHSRFSANEYGYILTDCGVFHACFYGGKSNSTPELYRALLQANKPVALVSLSEIRERLAEAKP